MSDEERATGGLPAGRIVVPEHVVHRAFEAETVLLNLRTGQYHGLNTTAGRMLELLEETHDARATAEQMASEFDVELEMVTRDLEGLCNALLERGLIEIDERPAA